MTNNALKGLGGREEQPAGIKAICTAEPWSSSGAKKGERWGSQKAGCRVRLKSQPLKSLPKKCRSPESIQLGEGPSVIKAGKRSGHPQTSQVREHPQAWQRVEQNVTPKTGHLVRCFGRPLSPWFFLILLLEHWSALEPCNSLGRKIEVVPVGNVEGLYKATKSVLTFELSQ